MAGYPIDLDVQGVLTVVVGLGAVGKRKAIGLIEAGAIVRGVEPLGAAWAEELGIEVYRETYRSAHLVGAMLVIAAAAPAVNREVVSDARQLHILVSSASEPKAGNFTVPAIWRSGLITVTVSTGGASPSLAVTLRDRAARAIGPEAGVLAEILRDLRATVLHQMTDPTRRRQALLVAANPAWLDHLAEHGAAATRQTLGEAMGIALEGDWI